MNEELKRYARSQGVYLWQIADKLAMSEATVYRRLRHVISDEEHAAFVAAVHEIIEERNTGC